MIPGTYLPPALAEEVIFSVASVCVCVSVCPLTTNGICNPYFVEYRHVIYRWKAHELIFQILQEGVRPYWECALKFGEFTVYTKGLHWVGQCTLVLYRTKPFCHGMLSYRHRSQL